MLQGLRSAREGDPLEERLAEFAEIGEPTSLEDIEMSQPFMDRVVYPTAQRMGEIALRFTPQTMIQDTQEKLEMAGNPRGLDPTTFLAARFVVGAIMGAALFFVFLNCSWVDAFSATSLSYYCGFYLC